MVYTMEIYVDGGCRGNGRAGSFGAAAAVFKYRFGHQKSWYRELPSDSSITPTNQRAEISAIILGLEQALELDRGLSTNPYLVVTVHSDSKYAIGCMNDWIYKWCRNGWINSAGRDVANRDLIQKASNLDDELKERGEVKYVWISREMNEDADELCNRVMDDMAQKSDAYDSYSSDGY